MLLYSAANMLISKTPLNNVIHVVGDHLGALALHVEQVAMIYKHILYVYRKKRGEILSVCWLLFSFSPILLLLLLMLLVLLVLCRAWFPFYLYSNSNNWLSVKHYKYVIQRTTINFIHTCPLHKERQRERKGAQKGKRSRLCVYSIYLRNLCFLILWSIAYETHIHTSTHTKTIPKRTK